MIWRLAILGLAITSLGAAPKKDTAIKSLRRGIELLMSQQSDDGGWHSETYGSMRQGAAVTSSVLYALSHVPPEEIAVHKEALTRAFAFLREGISKKGYVVNTDGSADFPTYATSMLLVAAKRLNFPITEDEETRMVRFIADAQLTETREFGEDSVHHGGWDLMGAQQIVGQTSGTNVSICRFATEALAMANEASTKIVRLRARRWSGGVQNLPGDGGFYFTPDAFSENNKALFDKDAKDEEIRHPRSYGTCTCDGVLLLVATGMTAEEKRVAAAVKWLSDHPDLAAVPGFPKDAQATDWQNGLRFYYYAALAKTLRYLPKTVADSRRATLIKRLVDSQASDGSWRNPSARMREDDPLICTSFALTALGTLMSRDQQ